MNEHDLSTAFSHGSVTLIRQENSPVKLFFGPFEFVIPDHLGPFLGVNRQIWGVGGHSKETY
jgi:hypothetical protein